MFNNEHSSQGNKNVLCDVIFSVKLISINNLCLNVFFLSVIIENVKFLSVTKLNN